MDESTEIRAAVSPREETWQDRAQKALWTFLTIAAAIIFYHLLQYLGTISAFIGKVLHGMSPVLWGLVFAYLLAPIASFYERNITEFVMRSKAKNGKKPTEKTPKRIRGVTGILTLLTAIIFIAALLLLIIPEIYNSLSGIIKELPSQIETMSEKLANKTFFDNSTAIGQYANNTILEALNYVRDWLLKDFSKQASTLMEYFYTGVKGAVSVVYNLVIGLILSMYITIDKEKLQNQIKKLAYAILPTDRALGVRIMFNRANKKLSTAIRGKIVDSMIIGMIHFIMLSFANLLPWFNYPYPVLLAAIVGLTNVVPFFGPIVGGFITAVLVLFENPSMTIPYLVMVVILQQFDGNFLDPHIVGGSIGLRPLWSISACLLGSAILGVPGFVLGPPFVSFVYEVVSEACDQRLRKKELGGMFHLPTEEEVAKRQAEEQHEIEPEAQRLEKFMHSSAGKLSGFLHNFKKNK
ncbi:MAG: AI-2E family transporter [Oscillospiraceae bacterium]|nr:AI-2E family transporter [Oscillospiraceae bacterium]